MSQSNIAIGGGKFVATEERSRSVGGNPTIEHYQHVVATAVGVVPLLFPTYLKNAGSVEMNVNAAAVDAPFDLAPADPTILRVERLVLMMRLSAQPLMTQFGTVGALADGLLLEIRDATGLIRDLTGGLPLQSNDDLATFFDFSVADLGASHTLKAEWRFTRPLRLEGGLGEFLRCTVRDDLTGITRMRLLAGCAEETVLT